MREVLPKSWLETELGNILSARKGKKPEFLIEENIEGYLPYILIEQLEGKPYRLFTNDEKVVRIDASEVIIVWDGSIGKCGSGFYGALGSTFVAMKPLGGIPTRFLEYIILRKQDYIKETSTGVGLQHINKNFFKECIINFPPLAEQKRIVVKLDILFAQHEAMKKALERIPQLLKDFKQQVLTQAVTGKLTEEWREGKGLEEWTDGKIEDFLIFKGIFDGPFGSNLKTEDYSDLGDVQVVRLENIDTLKFLNDKQVYVTTEKYKTLLRHEVFGGDIIFSSFIADRIRACILPENERKMIAKADCFCLRADEKLIINKFLVYFLVSPIMFKQLQKEVRGATRPRINTTILKKSPVNIPPISEQKEIVSCIESLFVKADRIEERYNALKAKIEDIPQSILHKAFNGELVKQLPTDGDARTLLEEIGRLKSINKK